MKTIFKILPLILCLLVSGCLRESISWIGEGGDDVLLQSHEVEKGESSARFFLMGDAGRGSDQQVWLSEYVAAQNVVSSVQGVLLLGDNMYSGEEDYQIASEEKLFQPMKTIFEASIPVYSILGNHDHENNYADDQMNDPRLGMNGNQYYRIMDTEGLYSVYMLDSETIEVDQDQQAWLKESLADDTSQWVIIALHTPPWTSDVGHRGSEGLARVLEEACTDTRYPDLVISGHNHIYERRKIPSLDSVAIIAGASGRASNYDWPDDDLREAFHDNEESIVSIVISLESITGSAISVKGFEVDHFVIDASTQGQNTGR